MPITFADALYPNQGGVAPYGLRPDGTPKGSGFMGELARPDGGISTEISVGVQIDGKETEIPLLVPTLSKKETEYLLKADPDSHDFFKNMPDSIMDKAIAHAKSRIEGGKSVFADSGDLKIKNAGDE